MEKGKRIVRMKGLLEGIRIGEEDIKKAKKTLFKFENKKSSHDYKREDDDKLAQLAKKIRS